MNIVLTIKMINLKKYYLILVVLNSNNNLHQFNLVNNKFYINKMFKILWLFQLILNKSNNSSSNYSNSFSNSKNNFNNNN